MKDKNRLASVRMDWGSSGGFDFELFTVLLAVGFEHLK